MTTNLPAVQNGQMIVTGANYVEVAVRAVMQDFLTINEGLDLDFVRMGDYIRIDKKGKFYDSADESNVFGEVLDVVVIQGEQRYTLWGHEKSTYKGQLIVSHREEAIARAALDEWLMNNPDAQEFHSIDDLELRYIAFVVPVSTISPDAPPQVYLLSLPYTATIGWGKYAMAVAQGRYKQIGVPARTSVKHVVTRVTTEDAKSKRDSSVSYLAVKFSCLGKFDPAEYGIDIDAVNADLVVTEDAEGYKVGAQDVKKDEAAAGSESAE